MNRLLAVPSTIAGALMALSLSLSPASAQASRTWVSGVGDDVNPCSRTAPCKTFAGAISKTATNGEIDCLDPGGFGTVTITKSITIDCTGTFGSVLNAGTNGITIPFDSFATTDARKTVNLRHLSLQGFDSGTIGIQLTGNGTGTVANIEDCVINGNFGGAATGISDTRSHGNLTIRDSTIRDMGNSGIVVGTVATLSNLRVINAHNGITTQAGAFVNMSGSTVVSNAATAVIIAASSEMDIDSSTIANNGTGIQNSGTGSLANSALLSNVTGISGSINSFTNNHFRNSGGGTVVPIGTTSNPTGLQ